MRVMSEIIRLFAIQILVLMLAGCGADDDQPGADGGTAVNCQTDTRGDTYVANLAKTSFSGKVRATLMSSEPGPPARGNNTWKIQIATEGGDPISGAPITVTPFMPDHGHGTSVIPTITPGENGTYDVVPVNLFMPGVWRITISKITNAGPGDDVVFFFCIMG